jgi:D-glycero-alpha-D-manno-heptose-7-phosphate kinase
MIITKTPYRISLFGGGTDHPAWYKDHGGEVISFAIDKFCYLTTRILPPFFDHRYRIAYSKVEHVKTVNEIQHPAVREGIRKFSPELALEIHHDGDLPARSGVGSSSAFAVGLIHSLTVLKNQNLTNMQLAQEAIILEQEILKENVGSQDQIACALGGMNYLKFGKNPEWSSHPILLSSDFKSAIEDRIVLIYSGVHRSSSDVQANFLVDLQKKGKTMDRTINLARECRSLIESEGDLDLVGEMLAESWFLKKQMNDHSVTPELENLWEASVKAGALGGKVLGAGGGGFCMFWVKEGGRESFINQLQFGTQVPVKISSEGTTCLLNS